MLGPKIVALEAGEHHICRCGKTANDPHCDGSHKGSGKSPAHITVQEAGELAICLCGRSNASPYCDGSH